MEDTNIELWHVYFTDTRLLATGGYGEVFLSSRILDMVADGRSGEHSDFGHVKN